MGVLFRQPVANKMSRILVPAIILVLFHSAAAPEASLGLELTLNLCYSLGKDISIKFPSGTEHIFKFMDASPSYYRSWNTIEFTLSLDEFNQQRCWRLHGR